MSNIMTWLTDSFAPKFKKITGIAWIAAIATSIQKLLPFILVSSLISIYNIIRYYVPILPDLEFVNKFSFGFLSVFLSFMVPYQGLKELEREKYSVTAGLTAIAVYFIMMIPTRAETDLSSYLIHDIGFLGGKGLFVAIIAGLFVMFVFHNYAKLNFLEDSVRFPDFVKEWINNIIPITLILLIIGTLVFNMNVDIFNIASIVFSPLNNIVQTLPGFVIVCFIYSFVYSLGISTFSLGGIILPVLISAISVNVAIAAGETTGDLLIATRETIFTAALITMGGFGATLPLNIMMLKAKSKKLRTLGKVGIAPSLFNINEPIIYGVVAFNPLLMIPMWLCTILGAIIVYLTMDFGLLNIPVAVNSASRIPAPFSTWMVTGDVRSFIWYIILFVLYFSIYYPFFKKYDQNLVEEETKNGK